MLDRSDAFTEKIFKVNIVSHFTLIQEYMPDMVKNNKGHIVGVASLASFVGAPGIVDYAATKAAVLALHEGWCAFWNAVLFEIPNIVSRSQPGDQARVSLSWRPEHCRASNLDPHKHGQRNGRSY